MLTFKVVPQTPCHGRTVAWCDTSHTTCWLHTCCQARQPSGCSLPSAVTASGKLGSKPRCCTRQRLAAPLCRDTHTQQRTGRTRQTPPVPLTYADAAAEATQTAAHGSTCSHKTWSAVISQLSLSRLAQPELRKHVLLAALVPVPDSGPVCYAAQGGPAATQQHSMLAFEEILCRAGARHGMALHGTAQHGEGSHSTCQTCKAVTAMVFEGNMNAAASPMSTQARVLQLHCLPHECLLQVYVVPASPAFGAAWYSCTAARRAAGSGSITCGR